MSGRWCFGYGSLVNTQTHPFCQNHRTHLLGWERVWAHRITTPTTCLTSLSIRPKGGSSVAGLLSFVETSQIADLDLREQNYNLHSLEHSDLSNAQQATTALTTYVSSSQTIGNADFPILQSYLDTVMQGFLLEFGEGGVADFLKTTAGWETPILKDRESPFYPRATRLSTFQKELFDQLLRDFGVEFLS